ncbi:MAG: PAS domain-containing protein [Candidatus Brocadiaceae bacterium]
MKILIVDDNIDDRLLIRRIIEKHGHDGKEAEDGQDGLEKAVIYKPDLIISDILMPHVDGFQFLRNIKKSAVLKSIPFIFYSAIYTEQKDRELARSLGAIAFISGFKDGEEFWRDVESVLKSGGTKETPGEKELIEDELYFLRNYSQVVVEKLEKKVNELKNEILEHKRLEKELKMSEVRLAEAQHIAHVGDWEWDVITDEVLWSEEVYRIFGKDPQTFTVTFDACLSCVHPDDLEFVKKSVHEALHEGKPCDIDHRILCNDGEVRVVNRKAVVLRDDTGMAVRMIGTIQDITERKRASEGINLLQTIMMSIPETENFSTALGIVLQQVCKSTGWVFGEAWLPSHNGRYLEQLMVWHDNSDKLEEFGKKSAEFTFPPGVGLPGRVWVSKKPEWRRDATINGSFPRAYICKEYRLRAAMGMPVMANDKVVAVLGFFVREQRKEDERLIKIVSSVASQLGCVIKRKRMVEEREKLREQLYHVQKLESVGKLAGGVAHEFNNILMVIMGYGSLLQSEIPEGTPGKDYIQKIIKSVERAAHLTQGLLIFSRKQSNNPKPVNLNDIIRQIKFLMVKIIGEDVRFETMLSDTECTVMADSNQIEQVLMNLVTNARDAMPNGDSDGRHRYCRIRRCLY